MTGFRTFHFATKEMDRDGEIKKVQSGDGYEAGIGLSLIRE
jgi:hypothetical protein